MLINPFVFREYDIRGIVERDFPADFVVALGRGFGSFVRRKGGKRIVLSGDVRLSTPSLKTHFTDGVLSTGVDIIDIGICPTPVNYYSLFTMEIDGAVQITGSHNPSDMNGFKMSYDRSAVYGQQIQEIRKIIEKEDFYSGSGKHSISNLLDEYIHFILGKIHLHKNLRVALDCGNAAACLTAPRIYKALGVDVKELYCEPDGRFPNHHPDPTVKENLKDLISIMKSGAYDVGIAFDGDADRIGVIDNKGEVVWADQLMCLFLSEIIQNGEHILFDVKCSKALEDEIQRLRGVPVIWKTGHSLIKQKMKELQCKFGGEMSGHIFFADEFFGYDDAVYVSLRLLRLLSQKRETLSELVSQLPRYYSTPELRIDCENDEIKFDIAKKSAIYFKSRFKCVDIDGVRITFDDGWGLIRASNTQPVIVCRFEATTKERLDEIKKLVFDKLKEFGDLTFPHD